MATSSKPKKRSLPNAKEIAVQQRPDIPKLNFPEDPYAILQDESNTNGLEDSDTNVQDELCTNVQDESRYVQEHLDTKKSNDFPNNVPNQFKQ